MVTNPPRLASAVRAKGLLKLFQSRGLDAYQVARGDDGRGDIIIQIEAGDGSITLYAAQLDASGERGWLALSDTPQRPDEARASLEKRRRFDPDLWVIDVYDPHGRVDMAAEEFAGYL